MSYFIYWSGVHEAFSRPDDSSLEFSVFGIVYKGFITAFIKRPPKLVDLSCPGVLLMSA
jgi:hypothetical protein